MSKQFKTYRIFLFFLFIISIHPWFMWGFPTQYIAIIGALYTLVLINQGVLMNIEKRKITPILAFLFLFLWMSKYYNIFGCIESVANWIIMVGIIGLKDKFRSNLIQFITKWFSILLAVSLSFYILHIFGTPLLHTNTTTGSFDTIIANYYTFVIIDGSYRFQSIFREPGYLTLGLAPLLFLNQYNYKNKGVLIMLLAQLFSFSLAGYIVMAIGYVYTILFSATTSKFKKICIPMIMFTIFIYSITEIYGENLFQDLIMSRLELEDGSIAGDNRSSAYLDTRFEQTLNSSSIYAGSEYDRNFSEKGVSGFKLYFVMYGLIGLGAFLWAYLKTYFLFRKKKIVNYGLIIILFLLLYQNAYPTMWALLIPLTLISEINLMDNKYQ